LTPVNSSASSGFTGAALNDDPSDQAGHLHQLRPRGRAGEPREGEVQWLSFVLGHLRPAVKQGAVDLWVDTLMRGGDEWNSDIERKLRECDVFVLLVSRYSTSSDYVVDKEIAIIRDRQKNGEDVRFYPLLLTHTAEAGLKIVRDKNLRPRGGRPFSSYSPNDRDQHMADAANEIAKIAGEIAARKNAPAPLGPPVSGHVLHLIFLLGLALAMRSRTALAAAATIASSSWFASIDAINRRKADSVGGAADECNGRLLQFGEPSSEVRKRVVVLSEHLPRFGRRVGELRDGADCQRRPCRPIGIEGPAPVVVFRLVHFSPPISRLRWR
jgi:TIR domain